MKSYKLSLIAFIGILITIQSCFSEAVTYRIQFGSFTSMKQAVFMKNAIEQRGAKPLFIVSESEKYRIVDIVPYQYGPYSTNLEAEQKKNALLEKGAKEEDLFIVMNSWGMSTLDQSTSYVLYYSVDSLKITMPGAIYFSSYTEAFLRTKIAVYQNRIITPKIECIPAQNKVVGGEFLIYPEALYVKNFLKEKGIIDSFIVQDTTLNKPVTFNTYIVPFIFPSLQGATIAHTSLNVYQYDQDIDVRHQSELIFVGDDVLKTSNASLSDELLVKKYETLCRQNNYTEASACLSWFKTHYPNSSYLPGMCLKEIYSLIGQNIYKDEEIIRRLSEFGSNNWKYKEAGEAEMRLANLSMRRNNTEYAFQIYSGIVNNQYVSDYDTKIEAAIRFAAILHKQKELVKTYMAYQEICEAVKKMDNSELVLFIQVNKLGVLYELLHNQKALSPDISLEYYNIASVSGPLGPKLTAIKESIYLEYSRMCPSLPEFETRLDWGYSEEDLINKQIPKFLGKYDNESTRREWINANYLLGGFYYVKKDYAKALLYLEKIKEYDKKYFFAPHSDRKARLYLDLGTIKEELKDYDGAKKEYENIVADYPSSSEAKKAILSISRLNK